MKLIANGRIWIDTEEGPFLGYGRIELLQKIKELGSLRKAAIPVYVWVVSSLAASPVIVMFPL